MKSINYKDLEFKYKVDSDGFTHFYYGEYLKTKWNFLGIKFGKVVSVPKRVFILDIDIESSFYEKKFIERRMKIGIKRWRRKLEIESGYII